MWNVCNKKDLSLVGTNKLYDVGTGKYMFSRWLSMTHPMNAVLANELFNSYNSPDDIDLLYMEASKFAMPYKSFRYIKKGKSRKSIKKEREFSSKLSKREKEMYSDTLDFLEHCKKGKRNNE